MYKYPTFFLLNMNRCFERAMEMWERLFGALVPKHPAHRTAVSLPHSGHTKADGLGPEGREPGETSKAECRSPSRRIEAHIGILSKASFLGLVCLSAVYSIDTEWRYPIFMDTFYVRQPSTSLPPHSPDPPQHTAFPPPPPGTWEDVRTHKKSALSCRDAGGITPVGPHGGPGSPEAAGVCPWVAPFSLISPKKPTQSYHHPLGEQYTSARYLPGKTSTIQYRMAYLHYSSCAGLEKIRKNQF